MTNDQLRAFIAVVEQGSFRAAASHIHKTQPSVSAAVSALEEQFNLRLFNRDTYRPTLTGEGKSFYSQARQVVSQVGELEAFGHRLSQGMAPTLSISLTTMCASPPGLDHIKRYCESHPQLQLNITTQHLSGVLAQLDEERAELAIGPQHIDFGDRYEYVEITRITMVTVAAPGFVDGETGTEIPHSRLRDRPQILPLDRKTYVNVLPGGHRWYANDYLMMKSLLLAGMGWARMPLHMVESELASRQLVPLTVENFNSRSQVPIYLIRLRHQYLSELARGFWEEMLRIDNPRT